MADTNKAILCVDDDQDILDFFETVLGAKGYSVLVASTAEQGLQVFRANEVGLVFVDLMMEEVDAGASFVKDIKALGSSVPIYMVTSVGDALNMTTDYSSLGLKGVLQKPVDIGNLMQLVESSLSE